MKRTTKWLALVLLSTMVTNSMAVYSAGDAVLPSPMEETASDTVELAPAFQAAAGEEITEWREEGIRHYNLGNGKYQAIVTASMETGNGDAATASTDYNSNVFLDTYISSSNPNGYYGNSSQLKISETQMVYMKFSMPELPGYAHIESASFNFWYTADAASGALNMKAYIVNFPWDESSLNWTTANSHTNFGMDTSWWTGAGLTVSTTSKKFTMNVTNAVKKWFGEDRIPNYGLAFKRVGGKITTATIMSSEAANAYRPYAVITYSLEELPVAEGTYYLRNGEYDQYFAQHDFDTLDDSPYEHCELNSYTYNESSQKWVLSYLNNGYYSIKSVKDNTALTVQAGKENTSGEVLVREVFVGTNNQQWKIEPTSEGLYKIKPRSAENYTTEWVMCVGNGNRLENTDIEQRAYSETDNSIIDEWILQSVDEPAKLTYAGHMYYSYSLNGLSSGFTEMFQEAAAVYKVFFGVEFQTPECEYAPQLDLSSECNAPNPMNICNDQCGPAAQCATEHHKSTSVILSKLTSDEHITYRVVDYLLCTYISSEHQIKYGVTHSNDKDIAVSFLSSNSTSTLQHELCHTLGPIDDYCTAGQECILKGNPNHFCDACITHINLIVSQRME